MKRLAVVFILAALPVVAAPSSASRAAKTPHAKQAANPPDAARWEQHSRNVTIMRDDWGIAHVYGKTDADAVFGMIYAQAEDDFNRVETNYINAMGCLAEAEGESKIYRDLRMKLFIDPEAIKKDYAASPEWLKKLMNAWADGLNYYLAKHPEVQPRVIRRFDPWMALTFTEGSIGGDIERVNLSQLEAFYGKVHVTQNAPAFDEDIEEPGGSNGMAIAPSNTVDHHALLLINPHTSFFFRSELQMASEDGLDAYGAVTWGQFFVYQGFNDRAGWMHTSSGASQLSFYLETVDKKGDRFYYKYGNQELLVATGEITVPYKTDKGMAEKKFTVFRTRHGPVVGETEGKWLTIRVMNEPVKALTQSYLRTKAKDYQTFRAKMEDFPPYVETGGETARGRHAIRVLEGKKDFTLDSLISAAYDSYLTWFEKPIAALVKGWEETPNDDPRKAKTAEPVAELRNWDLRWGVASVPTSLAVFWGEVLERRVGPDARKAGIYLSDYVSTKLPPDILLRALAEAADKLFEDFGTWKTPWGDINRFQRLTGEIVQPFSDSAPSIPVGFTSSFWGSLAAFSARDYPGTKKRYGASGNSFVAVVEFGDKVRARAVTAGGESGHPASPHFNDEAERYSTGNLREVYFYRSELEGHTERQYHPGS